jgi:hypothetical protein
MQFIVTGVDFTTLLFTDDKMVTAEFEDELQEAVYRLSPTIRSYNSNASSNKISAHGTCSYLNNLEQRLHN